MKKFEYFDHTADVLFKAYGNNLEEAFSHLVLAVYNVIVDTATVKAKARKEICVEAKNLRTLVYDVVDELLFYQDTESFLGAKVESCVLERNDGMYKVKIVLLGDSDCDEYDVFSHIKSPTYSQMIISEEKDNVFIQAVLDL